MRPEHYLNAVVSLLVAASLSYVVFAEHIKEGPIVKLGLITLIGGSLATATLILMPQRYYNQEFWEGLWNAGLMTRIGLVIVILGYWVKRIEKGHPCMRISDWQSLDEAQIKESSL